METINIDIKIAVINGYTIIERDILVFKGDEIDIGVRAQTEIAIVIGVLIVDDCDRISYRVDMPS